MLPQLDAEEQRVLGCLLEKQVTVPDSYPLSLNSLRLACNQTSSRDPVVDWDEPAVEAVARRLRQRDLVRVVWADKGRRTLKYHQLLTEGLELGDDERALLTVLLLRGPQAPGELKTRTERLHAFADRTAVEELLTRMAGRGLVAEQPRRAGERDARWTHLLGATETPVVEPPVEPSDDDEVRQTWTAVADDYAPYAADDLEQHPFERWLLGEVAAEARGPVVEVGCGPGHVTALLASLGAEASGLDLTPAMVDLARRLHPGGRYDVGDLRALARPPAAAGWAAVLAWHSLLHLAPADLPSAVAALARPLADDGVLVLALLTGGGSRRVTEFLGHEVGATVVRHERPAVLDAVRAAGLTDVRWWLCGANRDETAERLYVLARR